MNPVRRVYSWTAAGIATTAAATLLALTSRPSTAQQGDAFGDEESVAFAEELWEALSSSGYVGEGAIRSYAYEGSEPHGVVLEQVESMLTVDGRRGALIVKSNFMADGLTTDQVMNSNRSQYLEATTVMFKREEGYAPEAGDWLWAKYLPNGELDMAPNGLQMAGRVQGCIDCHSEASGGDLVFLHDRFSE